MVISHSEPQFLGFFPGLVSIVFEQEDSQNRMLEILGKMAPPYCFSNEKSGSACFTTNRCVYSENGTAIKLCSFVAEDSLALLLCFCGC